MNKKTDKPVRHAAAEQSRRPHRLEHWQVVALLLAAYDVAAMSASYLLALLLRFDLLYSQIPENCLTVYTRFTPVYALLGVLVFRYMKLYKYIWRFASYVELMHALLANAVTVVIQLAGTLLAFRVRMPLSYYIWGATFQLLLTIAVRFSYRFVLLERNKIYRQYDSVMLIGAGAAGQTILRDILRSGRDLRERVVCIIDDDPNKWNRFIEGVPVAGGREHILVSVQKYGVKKIYLTMPSASAAEKRDILQICQQTGCELKQLPGMSQLVRGDVTVSSMRTISMEDLLGREPIQADLEEVFRFLNGKVILVTGGGGSIGSELCRQIARHSPKKLIIFDIYENNAYSLQLELREEYPALDLVVLIGSVRDSRKLASLFETYRPEIVYHAAAHKHVPLMEDSPCEAIKNNTIGTYKTAWAAMAYGCERFVLISTDKAVNPTNVMGASKRLCEMIIQSFDAKIRAGQAARLPVLRLHGEPDGGPAVDLTRARTKFVAVRFGNVLGSNGSVVPIFKRQIEKGGPVTVTHPDIIRYFMTIPEAVSLVLLAGTYANGGEIFVLDLGSPVRIDTLARNLIRLSGYEPDVDIKVEYTGLRPGEKLFEEMLMAEEGLTRTRNNQIYIGRPIQFNTDAFLRGLEDLMEAAYRDDPRIREMVREMAPTYRPAGEAGRGEPDGSVAERPRDAEESAL